MQTQNVTDELQKILSALDNEGKTPTVALVKARLTTSVPMPAIISAVKSWKSSNKLPKIEVAVAEKASTEARISALEKQVQALTERLNQLEKTSIKPVE